MLEADPKLEGYQSDLYDRDFYAWTQQQVDLLIQHQWERLDLTNIVEEIESLGKQVRRELGSRLAVLIQHLLKWEYQPSKRTPSWVSTIRVQRADIKDLLKESPSLQPALAEICHKVYDRAVEMAIGETNLSRKTFPQDCPYSVDQLLDDRFYPGSPSDLLNLFEQDK
ncbi:DUF29 domain-containing protein [Leptolyngbya ohadii]|uniref:DUF29 domain-containing protein n=1 Tax=Leptolyngbya ohadii TaxID=1962290 RepID=UPI000B598873|nr:DUF29 domain-containing protein [Leptolyngbya ohadii]